jgi:hypothetical protein
MVSTGIGPNKMGLAARSAGLALPMVDPNGFGGVESQQQLFTFFGRRDRAGGAVPASFLETTYKHTTISL